MLTEVILVDDRDVEQGVMEKLEAHEKGLLHRAFSVFILNDAGEMLLQRRAITKYHSPGLWTNACCSHPKPGETTLIAAYRRLEEEMGFSCLLKEIGAFIYQVKFDNGLIEHEYDHLMLGYYRGSVVPNPEEVKEYKYLPLKHIDELLANDEEKFSYWFRIAYPLVRQVLEKN
jgi:isopentenyl-diphosphate delta-isomerase